MNVFPFRKKSGPLALNIVAGRLDEESRGIIAAEIVLHLASEWPDALGAIASDWGNVSNTVIKMAFPLLADLPKRSAK
jgi:hypothetical protein